MTFSTSSQEWGKQKRRAGSRRVPSAQQLAGAACFLAMRGYYFLIVVLPAFGWR